MNLQARDVPHMGWNGTRQTKFAPKLLDGAMVEIEFPFIKNILNLQKEKDTSIRLKRGRTPNSNHEYK